MAFYAHAPALGNRLVFASVEFVIHQVAVCHTLVCA
jgi:hypothetical protein